MEKIISVTILFAIGLIIFASGCVSSYSDDKYYFEMALNTSNESYCEKVTSKYMPNRTQFFIYGFTVTEDGRFIFRYSREECYSFLAQNKNDPEICKKLEYAKPNGQNLCITYVAEFNKDVKHCEMMVGADKDFFRNRCYRKLGVILKNPDYCFFGEGSEAANCISDIARQTEDLQEALSICEILESRGRRNNCYHDVASERRDKTICEKIEHDEDKKSMCRDVIDSLIELDKTLSK